MEFGDYHPLKPITVSVVQAPRARPLPRRPAAASFARVGHVCPPPITSVGCPVPGGGVSRVCRYQWEALSSVALSSVTSFKKLNKKQERRLAGHRLLGGMLLTVSK